MEFTRRFSRLSKKDADLAGGKGASLGEMLNAGIPVPDGFVVLAGTFEHFIKETDLVQEIDSILGGVDHKAIHTVDEASEKIRALILSKEMPEDIKTEILSSFAEMDTEFVAVRSSATAEDGAEHAWAGQLESYLNVKKESVLEKVQDCWSSLFTPRAIFYRFEKGLHSTHISVAVVVQKMVNSEVSGIAFSVHPVTEDYNQMIIEAGFGLGEAIVSGSVTPDSYVVEKEPRNILDINVSSQTRALWRKQGGGNEWIDLSESDGNRQVLDTKQILELGEIIMRIENHYGFPCDIEWAFEGGKFYIVQSRPITTLSKKEEKPEHPMAGIDWVKFLDRRRSCFIYHPYIEAEFVHLEKVTGFKYRYHLYKWVGDRGTHYRSASELKESLEYFLDLVKTDPEKVISWRETGLAWDKRAHELIDLFESEKRSEVKLGDFKKYYDEFVQILLHTVTVPYLALCGIDDAVERGESKKQFEKILTALDPLRGFTTYPKLERSMLAHFWQLISDKSGIQEIDLIDKLNPKEIINFIQGGKLPSVEELNQRRGWCVFWHEEDSLDMKYDYDRAIVNDLPVLKEEVIESDGLLLGTVAFPGYAKGIVCRVDNAGDMANYTPGQIIVSINTSPDLMPVLSTASAIVSEEGGIMCHAAIVSRELKKPCVIGTKIATKVFENGDEIEVDANIGLVRLIKKKASNGKHYEKTYTRDTTLIIQQGWHDVVAYALERKAGLRNPHVPPVVHFMNDGVIEIWENEESTKWFLDNLQNEIKKDENFITNILDSYEKDLVEIKGYWEKGTISTKSELTKYIDRVFEVMDGFVFMYYTGMDERTPEAIRERALKMRDVDTYFDTNDKLMRKSLVEIYPELKGYEAAILRSEIENPPTIQILKERKKNFMMVGEVESAIETLDSYQNRHPELHFNIEKPPEDTSNIIRGQIGNKGFAKGVVRILKRKEQINEAQEGDIIVSTMTTPDFVPALQKAAAVVTDEGGITCHAAIVARELNKPCVIGTKFATQLLKDGDIVEVDADKGVVRILK